LVAAGSGHGYNPCRHPTFPEERTMRLARPLIASLLIVGSSTSGFAGDLRDSIEKAAAQQETGTAASAKMAKPYLISGCSLFVVGLSMATYGFLHTSGDEFVSGQVSKESNTAFGGAGLALAGAGGAILLWGAHNAKRAPSLTFGPNRFKVSKQLTW
jgi:hypothetical protein